FRRSSVVLPAASVRIPITWEVTIVSVSFEGLGSPRCPECGTALNLHQPDEEDPGRLLATCGCGAWHMIEVPSGGTTALLFSLPDTGLVRAKHDEVRGKARRGPPS